MELQEDYWSPEYESVGVKAWKNSTFSETGTQDRDTFYTPKFEDLRKGLNINAEPDGGFGAITAGSFQGMWTGSSTTVDNFQKFQPSQFSAFFSTDQNYHPIQFIGQHRLHKASPVRRHGVQRAIH